jgi:hypothetical protein
MTAILALWNDCDEAGQDHYERWYIREHLLERVDLPGFRLGRRFGAVGQRPQFFTYYEVDSPNVLISQAYMACQQHPTPGTVRAMAAFSNVSRTVCDVVARAGVLTGAHVVTARFDRPLHAETTALRIVEDLAKRDGIARAQLWSASDLQTPSDTTEMGLRRTRDHSIAAALVVECVRLRDAQALAIDFNRDLLNGLAPAAHEAVGIYSFLCGYEGKPE